MKPLLHKTTRSFLIYVLLVLFISVPVYYFVVDYIWKSELDEHNTIIADKTEHSFNQLNLSDIELKKSIELWNNIQPGTNIIPLQPNDNLKDSLYTIYQQKNYSKKSSIDRFRCLSTVIYINKKPYRFIIETNIEESYETIAVIAAITVLFFLLIVAGLLILNRRLSVSVWSPFRNTLQKLKTFNLNSQTGLSLQETDIIEFEELNHSLNKLIDQNISVFKSQKEFTENASHELQTPLALLKNKLDILLQDENLTVKQYEIAEEMHKALTRSSRINKNLLLLAKIENSQFDSTEPVNLSLILNQSLESVQEHFEQKNLKITSQINSNIIKKGSTSLTEILINNLILNAISHTSEDGSVSVILNYQSLLITNSGNESINQEMLFKRFSKLSKESGGSGLGLSIIQEISKFQQWNIQYDYKNGQHQFLVEFPLNQIAINYCLPPDKI